MGGIDGLVNAAGIERHIEPQDITDDDWDVLMAINVTGTFLTNQAAFRYMREQGRSILNFGSDAGLLAYPSAAHYSASQRPVTYWPRTTHASWGRHGPNLNPLFPAIGTPVVATQHTQFHI